MTWKELEGEQVVLGTSCARRGLWGTTKGRERRRRTWMFCSATSTVLAADVNWDWTGVRSILLLSRLERKKREERAEGRVPE